MTTLVVFSDQTLRLDDHPALAKVQGPVVPVFVLDETRGRPLGGAARWWLKGSLQSLRESLRAIGSDLVIRCGALEDEILDVAQSVGAVAVHTTRAYAPHHRSAEDALNRVLEAQQIPHRRFAGPLLFEPDQVETKQGKPYTVFSPFWRMCLSHPEPGRPVAAPKTLEAPASWPSSVSLDALDLDPKPVDWAAGLRATWTVGEAAAHRLMGRFLEETVGAYKESREMPATEGTSRLSPYMRFGEISPRRIWHSVKAVQTPATANGADHYLRELGWREFSYHLLFHFPRLETEPLRENFKAFPWETEETPDFEKWAKGTTGFPIVDAGMRQLWETGWMHNRVRMIVSSFLVKDMLHHWRLGEAWFWDTLVDADYGNNIAGWQWAGGCGADAAPYFRIFNPTSQSEKFDPDGSYIKRYVPELSDLDRKSIHAPSDGGPLLLVSGDYPEPMLDRKAARARALAAFETVKKPAA